MSCNCKVKKEIINIHKNYGYKTNVSWKEKTLFSIKNKMLYILYVLLMLLLSPIILLFFIILLIKGNRVINVNDIIKKLMGKNG